MKSWNIIQTCHLPGEILMKERKKVIVILWPVHFVMFSENVIVLKVVAGELISLAQWVPFGRKLSLAEFGFRHRVHWARKSNRSVAEEESKNHHESWQLNICSTEYFALMIYFPVFCRRLCIDSFGDWVPAQYSDYAELQQKLPEGETLDFGSAFINL